MSTLLLRFAAPIQSWGADSKFERRTTRREPTKSGVIGLAAAALGLERTAPLDELSALRFGVRIDQPGQILRDYHTTLRPKVGELYATQQDYRKALMENGAPRVYTTERYYLCDAIFVVGLEGTSTLLEKIEQALAAPVFPLYLGRRSCPPVGRISLGIRNKPLEQALRNEVWQASKWYQRRVGSESLTIVLDSDKLGGARQRDVPISFDYRHKRYAYRYLDDIPDAVRVSAYGTEHDAFEEVEA